MPDMTASPVRPGWLARRRLAKIAVREAAALAESRILREQANTSVAVQETHRRADGKIRADQDARRDADDARSRDLELKQRDHRLTSVAGSVALSSLLVTAAGQIMFYTSMPWQGVFRVIAFVLFVFVEGPAWYFALNARDLADRRKQYGWSARRVWVFAGAACAMNSYHGAVFFGRWDMGLILGMPSLIGPYTWHKHVHRLEILAKGGTLEAVKAAMWRRIHHPVLSWRSNRMWAQTGGRVTKEKAFLIVFFEKHTRFPGELPQPALIKLQKRAEQRAAAAVPAPAETAELPSSTSNGQHAASAAGEAPVSAHADGERAEVAALTGAAGSGDSSVSDELNRYLESITVGADSAPDPALNGAAHNGHTVTSNGAPVNGASAALPAGLVARQGTRQPARQTRRLGGGGARRRTPAAGPARGDTRTQIEQHVADQLRNGAQLDDITGPKVAAAVGCGESTARNILKEVKADMAQTQV
jgi:hypothetical protein